MTSTPAADPVQTPSARDLILNPGLVLSPEELATGRANVAKVPPLSGAQLDRISAVFRPIARQWAAGHTPDPPC